MAILKFINNKAYIDNKEVEINDNKLLCNNMRLTEIIGDFPTNLTILDLSNNQLTSLPDLVGDLTKLKWLYLENNQLTSLPDSIGDLTKLKWLYLENNQLTSLPDISTLPKLESLDLTNNPFELLIPDYPEIKNLKDLITYREKLASYIRDRKVKSATK